jgi:hypothetical protein
VKKALLLASALYVLGGLAWAQTASTAPSTAAQAAVTQLITDTNITLVGSYKLSGITITSTSANGGFAMAFDSATVPADGALSPGAAKGCWVVPAVVSPNPAATMAMANTPNTPATINGLSVAFSTGADCYHLIKSAAYIQILYGQ